MKEEEVRMGGDGRLWVLNVRSVRAQWARTCVWRGHVCKGEESGRSRIVVWGSPGRARQFQASRLLRIRSTTHIRHRPTHGPECPRQAQLLANDGNSIGAPQSKDGGQRSGMEIDLLWGKRMKSRRDATSKRALVSRFFIQHGRKSTRPDGFRGFALAHEVKSRTTERAWAEAAENRAGGRPSSPRLVWQHSG